MDIGGDIVRRSRPETSAAVLLAASCLLMMALVAVLGCEDSSASSGAGSTGGESWSAWSTAEPWTDPAPEGSSLFPVRQYNKWGYIDKSGQLAIEFKFDDALGFSEEMAAVAVGNRWGYVDESGTLVIAAQFSAAGPFADGLAPVFDLADGRPLGYIDRSGTLAIPAGPGWRGAHQFSEGLAGIWVWPSSRAYIDTTGAIVFQSPEWESVHEFSEGLAVVQVWSRGYGYIDRSGRFVIEPHFLFATRFSNGLAVVEYAEHEYGIIDRSGHAQARMEYQQVTNLSEGRAAVLKGGGFAALEEGADPFAAHWAWGYLDQSGALVIPMQFKRADDFCGGLAYVEDQDGKMGYIDLDGNYIWREE
jgi:hypothetical protein